MKNNNNLWFIFLSVATVIILLTNSGCKYFKLNDNSNQMLVLEDTNVCMKNINKVWELYKLEVSVRNVSNRDLLVSRSFISALTYLPCDYEKSLSELNVSSSCCFACSDDNYKLVHPNEVAKVSGLFRGNIAKEIIESHKCDVVIGFKTKSGSSETVCTKLSVSNGM